MLQTEKLQEVLEALPNDAYVLIKFGNLENLKKLRAGFMYMKNYKYYNDLEKKSDTEEHKCEGMGDMHDGQCVTNFSQVVLTNLDTNKKFKLPPGKAVLNLHIEKFPVFCMFALDRRNLVNSKVVNDNEIELTYRFTDEQKMKMKEFGDSALVIHNVPKFNNLVSEAFSRNSLFANVQNVNYYDPQYSNHLGDVIADNSQIAFGKKNNFKYQQEFRIAVTNKEVEDHLEVNIGNLEDISTIYETNNLLDNDFIFTIRVFFNQEN